MSEGEKVQNDRLLSLEGAVREVVGSTERLVVITEQTVQRLDGIETHIKSQNERIRPLEASEDKRVKRANTVKKLIAPALAAMAGLFGAKFGGQLLTLFGDLFGK